MLQFRPIKIDDQKIIDTFIAKCDTHQSDFSLATLLLWTEIKDINICVTDKALYLTGIIDERFTCFSPLCDLDYYKTAFDNLKEYLNSIDELLNLVFCTRPQMRALLMAEGKSENDVDILMQRPIFKTDSIFVKNDRNQAEYCYYPDNLIKLEGKKYHNKKNRLSLFHRTYDGRYSIRKMADDDYDGICDLIINWNELRGYDYHEELDLLNILIKNRDVLGIEFHLLIIDGKISGMTIFQKLKNNVGVVLFEKCDSEHLQGFSILNQYEAEVLKDCVIINRQEDMGIEGLRHAKMSYHPDELVEKFEITENFDSQVLPIYQRIFGDSIDLINEVFSTECKVINTSYKKVDGRVVSFCYTRNKRAKIFDSIIDMPYIFGVATDENYRGRGYAQEVIKQLLKKLYFENNPCVMLYPENEKLYDFYKKVGFVTFNFNKQVLLSSLIRQNTAIDDYDEDGQTIITDLFNRANSKYKMKQYRTEEDSKKRIKEVLIDGGQLFVLSKNQEHYGYMFIDENKQIEEFIVNSMPINPINLHENTICLQTQLKEYGLENIVNDETNVLYPCQNNMSIKGAMIRLVRPDDFVKKLLPYIEFDGDLNVNFTVHDDLIRDTKFNLKITNGAGAVSYDFDKNATKNINVSCSDFALYLLNQNNSLGLPYLFNSVTTSFYDMW